MCHIAKLKKSRSLVKLKSAIVDLKARHGSLRNIARKLHLSWGEMQAFYMVRDYKKDDDDYIRKLNESIKKAMEKFYLKGAATFPLPEAVHSGKVFLNRPL